MLGFILDPENAHKEHPLHSCTMRVPSRPAADSHRFLRLLYYTDVSAGNLYNMLTKTAPKKCRPGIDKSLYTVYIVYVQYELYIF